MSINELLSHAADRWRAAAPGTPANVGVDLGTASCVLVVLDAEGEPLWLDSEPSGALADGVVVDFDRATRTVRALRERAEETLGVSLERCATAYPPMVGEAESRACRYVCESAGFEEVVLVDEVTAAATTLGLYGVGGGDGVVVDVGGGSTGVGVFRGGGLTALDDRPGGGHHLDLIVAGALGVDIATAEKAKREMPDECAVVLKPGLERIAESVRQLSIGAEDLPVHLAGGALMVSGADQIVARRLGRPVISYPHALWITPIGIARSVA